MRPAAAASMQQWLWSVSMAASKPNQTLPKDADALAEVLSKQKSRRDRLPDAERTEVLSPLPVAELRKYEAVKKAHPDALVCFAQNGYFELYGKDAEKAAPLLGTKLLEKKVRGKPIHAGDRLP
mgnify:CR=1 FL=1